MVSGSRVGHELSTMRRLGGRTVTHRRVQRCLSPICSLRHLVAGVACNSTGPQSLATFGNSLRVLPPVHCVLRSLRTPLLGRVCRSLSTLRSLYSLIAGTVHRSPPLTVGRKGVVHSNCGRRISGLHHTGSSKGS